MICYALVVFFSVALRLYLQFENKRREKREGVKGSAGTGGVLSDGKVMAAATDSESNNVKDRDVGEMVRAVHLSESDYDDVTDWKTFGFRYRL